MTVVNQLELVSAICEHLAKKHPGLPAAARYLNPVIEAADLIVVAYARPEQEVRAQMGDRLLPVGHALGRCGVG